MAHIKRLPTKAVHHVSPPFYASIDAESASQQLLAESQLRLSASKPLSSSALAGARLLNAARIEASHSRPGGMSSKKGTGKLSRPSMVADEQLRKNLARRGDLYEILSSQDESASDLGSSSPHTSRLDTQKSTPKDAWVEKTLPGGKPRCSAVCYRYDRHMGPHHQQCSNAGRTSTHDGLRCNTHVRKPATVRCAHMTVAENGPLQCRKVAVKENINGRRCGEHAKYQHRGTSGASEHTGPQRRSSIKPSKRDQATIRPQPKREAEPEYANDQPSKRAKSEKQKVPNHASANNAQHQVPRCVRKGTSQSPRVEIVALNSPHNARKEDELQALDGNQMRITKRTTSTHPRALYQPAAKQRTRHTKTTLPPAQPVDTPGIVSTAKSGMDRGKQDFDAEEDRNFEQPLETGPFGAIDQVFRFLDLEERAGKCQTELGMALKQTCDRSCILLQSEHISIDALVKDFEDNRELFNRVGTDVPDDYRIAFKIDAFGYIFRALASYLEAVYSWFDAQCDVVTSSLVAMRVLVSIMHEIFALKGTIAKWNVSLPQRHSDHRIVIDIDSKLIAPLRRVEKVFRARLSQLHATEVRREQFASLTRKREQDVIEERRIADAVVSRRKRWIRWQNLHVLRMRCEPDPFKRKKLVITKIDSLEEEDANGVIFERLPVFRPRSTPPLFWASAWSGNRSWTDFEEVALLEGLQEFAGPRVYENLFQAYCRPNGVLRDFNVADITTKVGWVRTAFLKLHQERSWDIPKWVKQIPILP
ncbi:hypothetical protein BKA66DRAFT_521917 [Pyrenochaeta sp. MPI-SDFR-AT-0127]|nr:hypothetical protein BKA66DRAFT_521917 [Pyrenochaeta sp. MPI-SDFR-AT-0127]